MPVSKYRVRSTCLSCNRRISGTSHRRLDDRQGRRPSAHGLPHPRGLPERRAARPAVRRRTRAGNRKRLTPSATQHREFPHLAAPGSPQRRRWENCPGAATGPLRDSRARIRARPQASRQRRSQPSASRQETPRCPPHAAPGGLQRCRWENASGDATGPLRDSSAGTQARPRASRHAARSRGSNAPSLPQRGKR